MGKKKLKIKRRPSKKQRKTARSGKSRWVKVYPQRKSTRSSRIKTTGRRRSTNTVASRAKSKRQASSRLKTRTSSSSDLEFQRSLIAQISMLPEPKAVPQPSPLSPSSPLPIVDEVEVTPQATSSTTSIVSTAEKSNVGDEEQDAEDEALVNEYLQTQDYCLEFYITSSTTCYVYAVSNGEGETRAAKVIKHDKLPALVRDEHLPQELQILQLVRHENIIQTEAVLSGLPGFSIVICEYAPDGDLTTHLDQETASVEQAKSWFRQISSAVAYLHRKGISHRDVKLDNILIFAQANIVKITDFGFATFSRSPVGTTIKCTTYCGTVEYQAPETLLCETPYDGIIADCFSLGVLLFALLTGSYPFGQGSQLESPEGVRQLYEKIHSKNWPRTGPIEESEELQSLLDQLLNPRPSERLQAEQIFAHRWMQ